MNLYPTSTGSKAIIFSRASQIYFLHCFCYYFEFHRVTICCLQQYNDEVRKNETIILDNNKCGLFIKILK